MDEYKLRSLGNTIQITGDWDNLVHQRMNEAFERTRQQMVVNMWGDIEPSRPLTKIQAFRRRLGLYGSRVRDAWLVLTGQVELYDGY